VMSIEQKLKRIWLLAVGSMLLILLLPYLLLTLYSVQAVPEAKINYLDRLSERHARYPIDERAWPIYREALRPELDRFESFIQQDGTFDSIREYRAIAKSDPQRFEQITAAVNQMDGLLVALHQASKLPTLGLELQPTYRDYADEDREVLYPMHQRDPTDFGEQSTRFPKRISQSVAYSLVSCPCQHLDMARRFWRLLQVDTAVAIEANDHQRVLRNMEASLGLSRQAANTRLSIESMVALDLFRKTLGNLNEWLEMPELSLDADQRNRLVVALRQVDLFDLVDPANEIEMNYDLVQRIYTDNGKGDGHLTNDHRLYIQFLDEMIVGQDPRFPAPESSLETVTDWLNRPFIVFSRPTRAEVTEVLDEHQRLLRDAWQPPYDVKKLQDACDVIASTSLPIGFSSDFHYFVSVHEQIIQLNQQQQKAIEHLEK